VTPDCAEIEQDELLLGCGTLKDIVRPRLPVDRRFGFFIGSDCPREKQTSNEGDEQDGLTEEPSPHGA
jgi:hypothetical protein